MIHSEPPITRITISRPKASAITLLVLSGPVVMCRKNTRCTPICAIASTTSATGMLGCQTRSVPATKNEVAVSRIASPRPTTIAEQPRRDAAFFLVARRDVGLIVEMSTIAHARAPEQIDDRKYRDPDDVERVPEQCKAKNAAQDVGAKAFGEHLRHHGQQPQDAGRDMQSVAADQREERRQESAARRPRAARDQIGEFAEFDAQERQAQHTGHRHRHLEPESVAHLGRDARHAAGKARHQQAAGFDRDIPADRTFRRRSVLPRSVPTVRQRPRRSRRTSPCR